MIEEQSEVVKLLSSLPADEDDGDACKFWIANGNGLHFWGEPCAGPPRQSDNREQNALR